MNRWRPFWAGYAKLLAMFIIVCSATSAVSTCWAYTPESPEVQRLLKPAVEYLERSNHSQVGGECLIALALYKAGKEPDHPKIKGAIQKAEQLAAKVREKGLSNHIYSEAIALIFLCDVSPKASAAAIQDLLTVIVGHQRPNGAWSYNPYVYDDMSQTQYGILSLWAAHHHEFSVPVGTVERAANWVTRVQDPSGGFSYSPRDPGNAGLQSQMVTPSMSAAGAGSLYVCCHLLGFSADANKKEDDGLPPALQKVEDQQKPSNHLRPTVTSGQALAMTGTRANQWFAKNLKYDVGNWEHYYLYGLERYMSFRELVEGNTVDEPAWYNGGVDYLAKTQDAGGSWKTQGGHASGPEVDTSFAVLFLTRSSKKSIQKAVLDEGVLIGGKGLPKNTSNISMQDGKVVTPQMIQDVDDLLKMMEDMDNPDFDPNRLEGLTLDADLKKRTDQLEKFREMVAAPEYEKRLASVKLLAAARELDNVPALIYALSDPNDQVAREARDGLRFISRKFYGFNMPIPADEQQAIAAQMKWTEWYLSIRPEGELMH